MFRFYLLFKIFGVPVYAQGILLPLVLLLGWLLEIGDFLTDVGLVVAVLAGPVLLHELGHSLAAWRCGVATRRLLLTPLGAFASFERSVTDPRTVFRIALAGPLVNLVLASLFIFLSERFPGPFLSSLVNVTLFLAVLGLLPGVPRDGSRILRSILSAKMDPIKAAFVTCRTAQLLAVVGAIIAFSHSQTFFIVAAICVFLVSQIELLVVRVRASPAGRLSEMFHRSFPGGTSEGRSEGSSGSARPGTFSWSWSFRSTRPPDSRSSVDEETHEETHEEIEAPRHADGERVIDVDADGNVKKIWDE